jgi:hypothetical protein
MTDPLSISTAAVGFVAFVLQVAGAATDFVCNAKDFPEEFIKLSLATNDFAIQVRRLSPTIHKIEEIHDPGGILPLLSIADVLKTKQTP